MDTTFHQKTKEYLYALERTLAGLRFEYNFDNAEIMEKEGFKEGLNKIVTMTLEYVTDYKAKKDGNQ